MGAEYDPIRLLFEQTCDIFYNSEESASGNLNWKMEFPDGQKVTMQLSLDPLLAALQTAAENGNIPREISVMMRDVILHTAERHTISTRQTIGRDEILKIIETLPWIDYGEVFRKIEERGRAAGITEGRAERDRELATRLDQSGGEDTAKAREDVSPSEEDDGCQNLAERIKESYFEIDSDVCLALRDTDGEYAQLWNELGELEALFPVIPQTLESNSAISLTAEEHAALLRYLSVKHKMENTERRQLYLRGHRDGFAYLKMIGAV